MSSLKPSANLLISRLHKLLTFGFLLITVVLFVYYFFALSQIAKYRGGMESKANTTYTEIVANPDFIDKFPSQIPVLKANGKNLSGFGLLQFSKQFGEACLASAIIFVLAYALLQAISYLFELDLTASYELYPIAGSSDSIISDSRNEVLFWSDILQLIPAIGLLLLLYAENAFVLSEPLPNQPVVNFGLFNVSTPPTWTLYVIPFACALGIAFAKEVRCNFK